MVFYFRWCRWSCRLWWWWWRKFRWRWFVCLFQYLVIQLIILDYKEQGERSEGESDEGNY
jgi:hypothetical protein